MALFVLGDTHLSLGASKPMDIFPAILPQVQKCIIKNIITEYFRNYKKKDNARRLKPPRFC